MMDEELETLLDLVDNDCAKRGMTEDEAKTVVERVRRESTENPAKASFYRGLYGEGAAR
jgi:hypothetical protein